VTPDRVALNAGTSGALRVVLEDYEQAAPRGLWRYRLDHRRSLMGGAVSNCGNVLLWSRHNLKLGDDWDQQIAQLAPDGHGLTVLPFLAGERSPLWNANAHYVLEGASLDTTPVEILRANLEAASLRFAAVADAVRGSLSGELQLVFSGGALEVSPTWAQMTCDAIGVPLVQSREAEASARGAALMALEACGAIDDVKNVSAERGLLLTPDADHHAIYGRALERQNSLYEQLFGSHQSQKTGTQE
jgi:gluconokinase